MSEPVLFGSGLDFFSLRLNIVSAAKADERRNESSTIFGKHGIKSYNEPFDDIADPISGMRGRVLETMGNSPGARTKVAEAILLHVKK